MQQPTKTDKAKELYKSGKIAEAMKIFSSFKLDFTKDQKRIVQIASECLNVEGAESFYKTLKIDTADIIDRAKYIIEYKYAL